MSNVLFILSGSIACYKACDAISQLVQRGHAVRAVATEAALKFVGAVTLEGLTRQPVASDLFARGAALDHIELTRWADLVIVCPATANTLNRMAAGIADDLAGALLLAHDGKKPLLIAPAMNPQMWAHPATVASIAKLREWGARFVAVGRGRTACGEVGEGRMAEPDEVVAAIEAALVPPAGRLRVVVTAGGTAEPIDDVRVITNTSTGETGARIADDFTARGHDVVLLRARTAQRPAGRLREETFGSFDDLDRALQRLLGQEAFDVIVHAAAVSDFAVQAIEVNGVVQPPRGKLRSNAAPVLRLKHNPKLLDRLREYSRNADARIVAFKLTSRAGGDEVRTAVSALFANGAADFVVHNDLARRGEDGEFPADIWSADGTIAAHCTNRMEIGPALEKLLLATPARANSAAASAPAIRG